MVECRVCAGECRVWWSIECVVECRVCDGECRVWWSVECVLESVRWRDNRCACVWSCRSKLQI